MNAYYEDYLSRKRAEYADFDPSQLAPAFIPFFHTGQRIKVRFSSGEEKTGTVGVTTGWRPAFLLMLKSSAHGSSEVLGAGDVPVAIKKGRTYHAIYLALLTSILSLPAFASEPCKVNVNAASPAEIQLLARTGEVLAGRIVAGRPLDAGKLDAVKGVGPSWLTVNGPHVAFTGKTTCAEKIKAAPKVAAQSPKL
jgi:hypothetical protein